MGVHDLDGFLTTSAQGVFGAGRNIQGHAGTHRIDLIANEGLPYTLLPYLEAVSIPTKFPLSKDLPL